MDLGRPIAYQVLNQGTPVYSADGEQVGRAARREPYLRTGGVRQRGRKSSS